MEIDTTIPMPTEIDNTRKLAIPQNNPERLEKMWNITTDWYSGALNIWLKDEYPFVHIEPENLEKRWELLQV